MESPLSPRDRVLRTLLGSGAYPIAWVEHGLAHQVVEDAYGVVLPAVDAPRGSFESHAQGLRRQIAMNQLTGRCNLELPYHYTMAPRITERGTNHGLLTDESSLPKLLLVDLTSSHWDDLKRLVDMKQDYAISASITTGIGHIWQTMDLMAFSVATVENPALLRTILDRYTEWTCKVISVCNTIGVDFYWSFDDFAFNTGPLYSPTVLREIVMPFARLVASEIRLPWIWHSDGNYMAVLDEIVSLGMNALNPLEPGCIDIGHVLSAYPGVGLVGGIDVDVLARGTEVEVRESVRSCFSRMNANSTYIAASSNSIPTYCNPANLKVMFDEIDVCSQTSGAAAATPGTPER